MIIPNDTQVPAEGITTDDINRKTIDHVTDNVDGTIPNSEVNIFISDITGMTEYTTVTAPGTYRVDYNVSDKSGNYSFYEKTMIVEGDIVISSGETFTLLPSMVNQSFIFTGESGTTSEIILSGYTSIISNVGGNFVWDLGGVEEHLFTIIGETINPIYNGTMFDITWDGNGSLLFTIITNI